MERITFGETDGDAEANCLRGCAGYTVGLVCPPGDDEHASGDYVLLASDNGGITVRSFNEELGEGVGPVLDLTYEDFDELHIY